MPERKQKNVRLSVQANQALRALKFDLELGDGEVIEHALEALAIRRTAYHISALRRIRSGLLPAAEGPVHRAALEAAMYALNYGGERFRVQFMRLESQNEQGDWFPVRGLARYANAAQEILMRARKLVLELKQAQMTVPLLLIACCEGVPPGSFAGLGVPEVELGPALRREVGVGAKAPRDITYDLDSKAVILERAYGIAALCSGSRSLL